jgi:hypothetical protein
MSHPVLGTRAINGQVMELASVSVLECVGSLPGPVVSCGTTVCCIVQVEVRMEVTEVMDELQRLLGGSAVGLEHDWHEDEAVGIALAELLLSVLQVVAQPLMLGRVPRIGGYLAYPWLVAVATRMGDGDVKHDVGAHVWEVPDDDIWYVPCFRSCW